MDVIEQTTASKVKAYITRQRETFPPESYQRTVDWLTTVQAIPYEGGTRREIHIIDTTEKPDVKLNPYNRLNVKPIITLYSLAEYYQYTEDPTGLDVHWTTIQDILLPYLENSDWSTMTMTPYIWPGGRYEGILRGGIGETNQTVSGAIGYIRLAQMANDGDAGELGFYLLNKALVSRFAQEKLVKYLYETGLQSIPSEPDWLATMSLAAGETGNAILWRNYWASFEDDVRRPLRFDQFGTFLENAIAVEYFELLAYNNMTPELGRFLRVYAIDEAIEWVKAVEENSPTWYKAYTPAFLGTESPYSVPYNARQIFMVKALILNETPKKLAEFTDIPWVYLGDYYYIEKLAEAIRAYRGYTWSE